MTPFAYVPSAFLVIAAVASCFVDLDSVRSEIAMAGIGLVSLAAWYLGVYACLSSATNLTPLLKACWALGAPILAALLLTLLSLTWSGGPINLRGAGAFVMTIAGQIVLWPGQAVGESWRSSRRLARTPDPCGADILRLDASGMFEIEPRALAVQPNGKILLLAELEGARSGTRLTRLFPDGRVDDSFAAGAGCLPGMRQLTAGAGGHILLYDHHRPEALLLDPEGNEMARFRRPSSDKVPVRLAPDGKPHVLIRKGYEPQLAELRPDAAPVVTHDYGPSLRQNGKLWIENFFFWPDGDIGLVGERQVEGANGRQVVLRMRSGKLIDEIPRPLGPTELAGFLSRDRLLFAGNWLYKYEYAVAPGEGVRREIDFAGLAGMVPRVLAAGPPGRIAVAGILQKEKGKRRPEPPYSFRLVLIDESEIDVDDAQRRHR